MTWKPAEFLVAQAFHTMTVAGYVYNGLGLHMVMKPSPKGRRPPKWSLTHLGSGLRVAYVKGKVAVAFPAASAIAECGDWDFDGIDGWKNRDPDLPQKLVDTCAKFKNAEATAGARHEGVEEVVQKIVIARAG